MTEAPRPAPLAATDSVDCSVLIPVLNEERHLERTVAAMRAQRFAGTIEFIFADGGSRDRSCEILTTLAFEDPRIRVVHNPRGTVSSGLNVALRHARGRYVARMDAHTVYPRDYLALGVERLFQPDTRWVSGPQVPRGDNGFSRAVALALGLRLGRGASRKWGTMTSTGREEYELDSGVFAGVWERVTLLEYGGWDERWRVNEDSEMAGRFLAQGERLVCLPAMAAQYVPRGTPGGLWRQYWTYGRYRARSAVRHPHTLRRSLLLPPAVALTAVAAATGPRRLRLTAYGGLLVYAGALGAAARSSSRDRAQEARLIPVTLAIMHLAFGFGFLHGVTRYGVPAAALARAAGLQRLAAALAPSEERVFNPSLGDAAPSAPARKAASS